MTTDRNVDSKITKEALERALEPPPTLPLGRWCWTPCAVSVPLKAQLFGCLGDVAEEIPPYCSSGGKLESFPKYGPASRRRTERLGSSDKRAAKGHPAEPAPTMMMLYRFKG
jgi:hypothetical protein